MPEQNNIVEPPSRWRQLPFSYLEEGAAFDAFAFRQIVDCLPQCIFWKDSSGRFLGCNKAGARAVGLAHPEEITGKTDFDFHADFHVAEFLSMDDEEVMADGTPRYRQLSQASGQPESARWYETSKVPLRSTSGEVVGLLISYDDVTERVHAEEALRQANEHLDVAANYTQNWNWWIGQDGSIRWISPSVEDLCGYSVFDCFGMEGYPFPIVHAEDWDRMHAFLTQDSQFQHEGEFRFVHKNGGTLWGSINRRHVLDRHGRSLGTRYSVHDITARKCAEMDLLELNRTLETRVAEAVADGMERERVMLHQSRQAAMGEMIGNIAHQWRQPLTTLGLLLQNLQHDAIGGAASRDDLDRRFGQAFRLIERMSATIDDFRNFFRTGDDLSAVDVCDCLNNALTLMEASLKHARIQVSTRLEATGRTVGRENELGQALLNLITNAKDALVNDRAEGRTITCEATDGANGVVVRIANNSGYIPPDRMDKIFDPYYTTKADGTGLGLYIARRIIDQHFHGSIGCANTGDGVEFVITLPTAAARD